jgi:NADPH-dependent 2,4-dienoyl-CoA reductase/sulfur reductase-like enzyme
MRERLVVIGGDAAGMSAASQARRRRSPSQLDIVAFERGSFSSYAACGLPYFVGDDVSGVDALIARSPEQHRANGIDLRMRHDVTAIDVERRSVRVRDLDAGAEHDEPFDQLVIATGARPRRPPLPGIELAGVHGVHTIPDALDLRSELATPSEQPRAVVVGGGYVGLEMAEAFLARGCAVELVHRGPQPMATLDDDMGRLVAEKMRALGIVLHLGATVTGFGAGADGRVGTVQTDRGDIAADVVALGLGIEPNIEIARAAGVAIGQAGGIVTDERMATDVVGVWAAGDCVETRHRVSGRSVLIALGTHANKQGRVVGINLTGGDTAFPGVIGTAITKVCAIEIARTGLSERECAALGIDHVAATIEGTTRAGYYPGADPITVRIVAARSTGRMLGAQIVGGAGAGKRIDAVAVAIWNEMSVEQFAQLDLAYAPPFSPVWDPLLIAARKAADLV